MLIEDAKRKFVHRYTMEHVPAWVKKPLPNGLYPAPQYATDAEWYNKTEFYNPKLPSEEQIADKNHCYSRSPSYPLGLYLSTPLKD
jgi:hypothetical protein